MGMSSTDSSETTTDTKASTNTKTGTCMMENGSTTSNTAKEPFTWKKDQNTWEHSTKARSKDRASTNGPMETFILVSLLMIREKVRDFISGRTRRRTKVNGARIGCMGLGRWGRIRSLLEYSVMISLWGRRWRKSWGSLDFTSCDTIWGLFWWIINKRMVYW